jgi:hypothetical protein
MKYYYIDAINGSDTVGDGTKRYPYATLAKCVSSNTFDVDSFIILKDGTYTLDTSLPSKIQADITVTIEGNGVNTRLELAGSTASWTGVGNTAANLVIRRILINTTQITEYVYSTKGGTDYYINYHHCFYINPKIKIVFYNIVFLGFNKYYRSGYTDAPVGEQSFFLSSYNSIVFWYCTFVNTNSNKYLIHTINYPVQAINCYGYISAINSYVNTDSIATTTPSLKSDTYEITDISIESSVGVYFGIYTWYFMKFIIYMGGNYYSVLDEFYNETTHMYNTITMYDINTNGFDYYAVSSMNDFLSERTIGADTFRPIDKFDNFKTISDTNNVIKAKAIKSNKELISRTGDIAISAASNITDMTLVYDIGANCKLRIALSTDKGITWKTTTDGVTFTPLDCEIPEKNFSDMTDEEKVKFNIARDLILSDGISPEVLNTIDFNQFDSYGVKFAYVINRPSYNDVAELKEYNWLYDAEGCMKELKDSEYNLEAYGHRIRITPTINADKLKVLTVL